MNKRQKIKIKRFSTQPSQASNENSSKINNLTIKDLKIHVGNLDSVCEKSHWNKNNNNFPRAKPLVGWTHSQKGKYPTNIHSRLPELQNCPFQLKQQSGLGKVQNRKGPMFVANSLLDLFQGEDYSAQQTKQRRKMNCFARQKLHGSQQINEFIEKQQIMVNSTKNSRGPRIISNDFLKSSDKKGFLQRKIYSEDNKRNKQMPWINESERSNIGLVTFYKKPFLEKKEEAEENCNQFL